MDFVEEDLSTSTNFSISTSYKWRTWKENILEAAKETPGTTKNTNWIIQRRRWWNKDIQDKIKETKQENHYEEYKKARQEAKVLIKEANKNAWREFGNKITERYSENQKLFYNTTKQLRNKKQYTLKNIRHRKINWRKGNKVKMKPIFTNEGNENEIELQWEDKMINRRWNKLQNKRWRKPYLK